MRDKENPTGWLIVDGGKKEFRQCLWSGGTVFKNPNPQVIICIDPLGQKEILSRGKYGLYFFQEV